MAKSAKDYAAKVGNPSIMGLFDHEIARLKINQGSATSRYYKPRKHYDAATSVFCGVKETSFTQDQERVYIEEHEARFRKRRERVGEDKNRWGYSNTIRYPWGLKKAMRMEEPDVWADRDVMNNIYSSAKSNIESIEKRIKNKIAYPEDKAQLKKGKEWVSRFEEKRRQEEEG